VCNDGHINAESVCELLRKLAKKNRGAPVKVVLGNASCQRCQKVQGRAAPLGIEPVFLPPCSPQFNLIGRFWRFLKKECLYSKYHENFQSFKQAIEGVIENLSRYKKVLDTLITPNFQDFSNVNIRTV
jgi:transposase